MKICFVFLCFVALAISDEEHSKILEECTTETGFTESEVMDYLLEDDAESDVKATQYMTCFFKKADVLDDKGDLDVEKARSMVNNYLKKIDAADDQEALDCIQEKETTDETVLALAKCVEKRKVELIKSK